MAIKYEQRPITVTTSTGSSSTSSTETGKSADGRVIAVRTLTDDGTGGFVAGLGTVNYVGKQVSVKLVSFDRSTESYKSDHERASDFETAIGDGGGSASGGGQKGGSYSTTSVGEELLAAVSVRYRVGAGAPRAKSQSYVPPAVVLDLAPLTTDSAVPGSVAFRWMGAEYSDFEGVIYRGRTSVSAGVASGVMDYAGCAVLMTDYVVGGTGPTDFVLLSLLTQKGAWTTASLFFNTESAPLRAGPGGFVLTVVDTQGTTLMANVDALGNITGSHMRGKVDFSRGGVELQFGDFVLHADLLPEQKTEWWYSPADVGAVEPGMIWRPWPVIPATLRYSAVTFIYLPVDAALMGIDPAALPADGRVAFARPGDTCVVGINHGGPEFAATPGMVYSIGHERLSLAQVLGPDGAEILIGFTTDLDAGTVTFNDVTSYPALVRVVARTEVYKQIAEVRIDGKVRLTEPIGHAFPVGAVFSTALRQGDRFARVTRVYDQLTWSGTAWVDGLSGSEALASYNSRDNPVEVSNRGAITERWALRLRNDATTFDLIGRGSGQIASGTINADFAPMNTAAGAPYFTIKAAGWGSGWIGGNVLFIDTTGAEFPIDIVRCTQPSSPVGVDDSFWLVQRGDVDRPASSSF